MSRLERGTILCDRVSFDRVRAQLRGRYSTFGDVFCFVADVGVVLPRDLKLSRYLDHFFILSDPARPGSDLAPEKALFDLIASEYNQDVDQANNIRTANTLLRLVAAKRVLDLGCGTGLALQAPLASSCDLVGVDASDRMLKVAREAGMTVLDVSDVASLPDGSFDGIISCYALHLHGPRLSLAKSVRLLASGGRIAANFHKGIGYAEVSDCLSGSGFEVVEPLRPVAGIASPVAVWGLS